MKATQPDNKGHFGKYGGMYVPEHIVPRPWMLAGAFTAAQGACHLTCKYGHYVLIAADLRSTR